VCGWWVVFWKYSVTTGVGRRPGVVASDVRAAGGRRRVARQQQQQQQL